MVLQLKLPNLVYFRAINRTESYGSKINNSIWYLDVPASELSIFVLVKYHPILKLDLIDHIYGCPYILKPIYQPPNSPSV